MYLFIVMKQYSYFVLPNCHVLLHMGEKNHDLTLMQPSLIFSVKRENFSFKSLPAELQIRLTSIWASKAFQRLCSQNSQSCKSELNLPVYGQTSQEPGVQSSAGILSGCKVFPE